MISIGGFKKKTRILIKGSGFIINDDDLCEMWHILPWVFLSGIMLANVRFMCTIYHIYRSPIVQMHSGVRSEAKRLLSCAPQKLGYHNIQWHKVEECIDKVTIKDVAQDHLPDPGSHSKVTAFVNTFVPLNTIYLTPVYQTLDTDDKAFTLIHECTHLALGAEDYAYLWQRDFSQLTYEEELKNADSIVVWIIRSCYRRRRLREAQLGTEEFSLPRFLSNKGDIGRLRGRSNRGDIGRLLER